MSEFTLSPTPENRRLAAVVFTDVVGYSARMQRDETGTIALVEADFARMRSLCAEFGGEVLNSMGDGLLLCFPSAARAVSFALKLQEEFSARNPASATDKGLEHRVGVHLGDVIFLENGTIAGDGVNIASRIEARAPPGGVCVSQTVYDTVKGKVPMQATFIGPQNFKNIAQPIPIWHVRSEGAAEASATLTAKSVLPASRNAAKHRTVAGISAALILTLAAGGWLWSRRDASPDSPPRKVDVALNDGKSIAVLPFTNMSDNKENAYFADGMQEELLTQLALLGDLKVVSRTSVMDYRDTRKNVRQIGTELGVRTLVEGSVRRAGDVVRVTVQLIDTGSDKHIWANSYERKLKDIFAIQNELATEIAHALQVSLSPRDQATLARKPTENLEAYDLFLRHQELFNRSRGTFRSVSTVKERIALLSQAVELDPAFALAWARLAAEHARAYDIGIDGAASRLAQATQAMERALKLAPDNIEVQVEEGNFQLFGTNNYERAALSFEKVLQVAPNNVEARLQLAYVRWREHRWTDYSAEMERVLAIDGRNLGALSNYASFMSNFRYYDRALALQLKVISIRPDDLDLQGKYQNIEYAKTGSWVSFDKWRLTLPPGVERVTGRVWFLDKLRAWGRRDFDGLLRLLDSEPGEVQSVQTDRIADVLEQAFIYLAKGDRSRAIAATRRVQTQAAAALRERPDDLDVWSYSYFAHAILGERDAALAEHGEAYKLAIATKGHYRGVQSVDEDLLALYALMGDRAQALQELSRQVRFPGNKAHEYQVSGAIISLWDDPRFLAIVNDPANNAPLPLDFQYPSRPAN